MERYNIEEGLMKEINRKELAQNNGKEGKATHVAVKGKVYDVSDSKRWKNGLHMNRHEAGQDLSDNLKAAPHGEEVLEKFTHIGVVKPDESKEKPPIPGWLFNLLEAHPFFKRHPHPMVVHFPMAFFITAPLFLLWYYLISATGPLLDAVFYMHILGTMSLPVAIATGWLSWQVNYLGKPNGLIIRKIVLSVILLILDVIVLIALVVSPAVLATPTGAGIVIPIFIIAYLPITSIIGQHGGALVFPVHEGND